MLSIENYIKYHERIRFVVEEEDYRSFLIWAKENNCLWIDCRIINPNKDKPDKYTKTIIVRNNKLIHHPHGYLSLYGVQSLPCYDYKDIEKDVIDDIDLKERLNYRASIQEKEELLEKEKESFEDKIKRQRIINQRQLKYQKYTLSLPKYFVVKYKDINEFLELYYTLSNYGYEDYYNIGTMYPKDYPKVIIVDNRNMCYMPADFRSYAYYILCNFKFYSAEKFNSMFKKIFENNE